MVIVGRLLNTDWCQCTNCSQMNSVPESICCRERDELRDLFSSEINCITRHAMFNKRCLSQDQLIHTLYLIGTFTGKVQNVHANR
ncbi:hypothetical protein GDO81_006187 [Engystomops pustulosus]|uniref:P2X purinoreceptor 7 intracellular domain-containing protein n=2 Tax=Engystomops pustulosus TaxID=76066 RepID=A0AAV7CV32_ENGPU|nr:hypothetical protein GDO81_006187 [Engystomops pustulosus]